MSASVWQWPALIPGQRAIPPSLKTGRAVWGKVDGAASDYRWIASSPGLNPHSRKLERELLLGTEDDAPERASCWRALNGSYCAVSCYRSRAMDAARRSGFLEKQVLEWRPEDGAPATLGALLLLPRVAGLGDEVWWQRGDDPGWESSSFLLTLDAGDAPLVEVSDALLEKAIEKGCAALRESVEEAALAAFYSAVLSGIRPAVLPDLSQPLAPEAVSALLLPLSRDRADQLSMAGWVVSQRIDPESFVRLWDILLCQRVPSSLRGAAAQAVVITEGREAARAVLGGEPPRSARSVAVIPSASVRPPAVIETLMDFATDDQRRWLGPEDLGMSLPLMEERGGELTAIVLQAREEAARADDKWQEKHLLAKADLLRAAALVLAPSAGVDLPESGRFEPGRVPALLFAPKLKEQDWDTLGERLGRERLAGAVRQSVECEPNLFGEGIRNWMGSWKRLSRLSWLPKILEIGLSGAGALPEMPITDASAWGSPDDL